MKTSAGCTKDVGISLTKNEKKQLTTQMSSRDQNAYLESEQLFPIIFLNELSNTLKHCLAKI